jgi:hypothetical protein
VLKVAEDGTIEGVAQGQAIVKVTHQALDAMALVTVEDNGPPCSQLLASYDPPAIGVGGTSRLQLTHGPKGCIPPQPRRVRDYNPAEGGAPTDIGLDADGNATGKAAGFYYARVEEGETDAKSSLAAVARIAVTGGCSGFAAAADNATIPVGGEALLVFTFTPSGCVPLFKPRLSLYYDAVTLRTNADGANVAVGVHGGQSTIVVDPDAIGVGPGADGQVQYLSAPSVSLTVKVDAPACARISIVYPQPVFDPNMPPPGSEFAHAGGAPALTYTPEGCTRPDGRPRYSSDTKNFEVAPSDGSIELHPSRGNWPTAIITVTHGTLTAETKVGEN